MPKENKVVVEGVNVQTKHQKQTRTEKAEIKHIEGPIDVSNVMFYDAKAKEAIKIGYKVDGDRKSKSKQKNRKCNRLRKEETILTARLRETYKKKVFPALKEKFNYENVMEVPKLVKGYNKYGSGRSEGKR